MFQKLTIYRIANLPASAELAGEYLSRCEFVPTTPNQVKASGFIPPRAEHGAFVESIAGQWIACLLIETRKVPSDALQRRIDEIVAAIEQNEGRKPGRKERREIKEEAVAQLLPQAFPKRVTVPVWIDPAAGLVMIGSTSSGQVDEVVTGLVRAIPDVAIAPANTAIAPRSVMASWLIHHHQEGAHPSGFDVGRECELRASDESKAVIRYKNESLGRDEVLQHIQQGKRPTRLALTWDDRVAFVMTDALQLKAIKLLEIPEGGNDEDAFDADVAIFTAELRRVIAALFESHGGMVEAVESEPEPERAPE